MLPKELVGSDRDDETRNSPHKKSSLKKHKSTIRNKKQVRKSKLLLSMPTRSEISLEKMIKLAKIHREANRPLIKIKEFDNNTKFCQCCSLPAKDDICLRNCSFCENTDQFAEFGRGTSLYFSFFRFSIVILLFCSTSMALPAFFMTSIYTNEITDACQDIYDRVGENMTNFFDDCLNYVIVEGVSYENKLDKNDWEFRYNSRNILSYRGIYSSYGGDVNKISKVIINYKILHLIGLISLFIINVLYIILLANINKQHDMNVTSPGDFTIIISNLYSAFDNFWKNIKKINENLKKRNSNFNADNENNFEENKSQEKTNYSQAEMEEAQEIGLEEIPKGEEINILEAFNQFIKNKICTTDKDEKFNIYQINICYKINDFMSMQEKIQEIKREIYKINNEKFQIIKNRLMGLENADRRFFYNPLDVLDLNVCQGECCERYHILSDIIDEKSRIEKELKELLEESKTLTDENFSRVAFITFNTIEEHENFLKPYPKNIISSFVLLLKI
jgi:hypothetical protein